jgi:hypothetical protein
MNAAIRRADGDRAALELVDPRYPMSHPSMRAVALRTSEGMLAPSEGALRTSDGSLPTSQSGLRAAGSADLPERSRLVVKSFHPKAKRQGWPALIAVAAGLLIPLAFQTLHRQGAAAVESIVTALPVHSSPVPPPPPASAPASAPAPVAEERPLTASSPGVSRDAGTIEKIATPRPAPKPRPLPKKPVVLEEPY